MRIADLEEVLNEKNIINGGINQTVFLETIGKLIGISTNIDYDFEQIIDIFCIENKIKPRTKTSTIKSLVNSHIKKSKPLTLLSFLSVSLFEFSSIYGIGVKNCNLIFDILIDFKTQPDKYKAAIINNK